MEKIYIISGPAGVGKTTTAKKLATQFDHSAYIEGDLINHMVVGGYLPPWESEELLVLTWENIADLSINFIRGKKNVVIDYVADPEEIKRFSQKVRAIVKDIEIIYVILWVDRDELLRRDALRIKEYQMGARCLELMEEFESKGIDERFFCNTTNLDPVDLNEILLEIKTNPKFNY